MEQAEKAPGKQTSSIVQEKVALSLPPSWALHFPLFYIRPEPQQTLLLLAVKKLLGYKHVENSMKYIGLLNFKDDQFEVTTATTVEEAKTILGAGFDYVTEKSGIMLFRRPKRFSKYA